MKMLALAPCELGIGVVTTRSPFVSVEISHEGMAGPVDRWSEDFIAITFTAREAEERQNARSGTYL
jgi:hypothetical protein